MEEFKSQESSAPFNMALATLEALRRILSHIEQVYADPLLPDELKQKIKINLLKRFYVDSSPLLRNEIVEKYKEVLSIVPKQIEIISNGKIVPNKTKLIYDDKLEEKLDTFLVNIQRELQKENYFMPPRKNLGEVVGSFS